MTIKVKQTAQRHMFMPGETVTGAIKKHNLHDVTKEEMVGLLEAYKAINGEVNMKAGMSGMIPILRRHQKVVFG